MTPRGPRGASWAGVAAGVIALALPGSARATDCGQPLLSTCIDSDHLWMHAGSAHFLSVGDTGTLEEGRVGVGLAATYQSRPITLTASAPGPGSGALVDVIDNQVTTSFLWSYGLTNRLELDVVLPVTFGQSGTGTSSVTGGPPETALSSTAVRDLRFGLAYNLLRRPAIDPAAPRELVPPGGLHGFGLTARFEMSAPTGDTKEFATNGTAVWVPGLSADYRYGRFLAGAEVAARIRPTQEFEGARVGTQLYAAVGAAYDILPRELFSVGAEAFFLPTIAEQHTTTAVAGVHGLESVPDGQYITPAEWMLSVRSSPLFGGALQLQLAGGGPIAFSSDEITNPRFRFTFSIRYARQERDSDHDGVSDVDDKCPFVPGVAGNPAGAGCPPSATTEKVDLSGLPPADAPPGPTPPPPAPGDLGGQPK